MPSTTIEPQLPDLNLGVIGNCTFNALIDRRACVVWSCLPRPDSDPVFNALLGGVNTHAEKERGIFTIDLQDGTSSRQSYRSNTAVLATRRSLTPEGVTSDADQL